MDSKFNNINLQEEGLVSATSRINEKGETIIYWTDGVNPPRFYNIDTDEGFTTPEELNIFASTDMPIDLDLLEVSDFGGSLISGAYQFAARYVDNEGNTGNFTTITSPIDVVRGIQKDASGDYFNQGNPVNKTSKSIKLELKNLDVDQENVQVAAIRYESGGIAEVNLMSPRSILETSMEVIYTGNQGTIDGSIEEILIDNAYYDTAKYITQVDDTLYMGNLTKPSAIRYQRYANAIQTYYVTKNLNISKKFQWAYGDETLTYYSRGFKRDEVYAFYISFVLTNGQETKAFHIPGGNLGGMRVWENGNETYPDTDDWDVVETDIFGVDTTISTLRNTPVKHHRFPTVYDEPIYNVLSQDSENASVSVLGVRFTNISIPDDIRENVAGIKLYMAKKDDENKLILDQGLVTLNKRTNEGTSATEYGDYENRLPEGSGKVTDVDVFSCVPFRIKSRDSSIASVTHIQKVCKNIIRDRETFEFEGSTTNDVRLKLTALEQVPYDPSLTENDKREIKAIANIPSDTDLVNITNLGFDYNKTSNNEHSSVLIAPKDPLVDIAFNPGVGNSYAPTVNLMQDKDELFSPFDLQELVLIGSQYTNIEDFSPENSTADAGTGDEGYASGNIFIDDDAPPETVDDTGTWKTVLLTIDGSNTLTYDIQYGDTKDEIALGLAQGYSGTDYTAERYLTYKFLTGETIARVFIEAVSPGTDGNATITVTTGDETTPTFTSISTIEAIDGGAVEKLTGLTSFKGDTYINKFGYRIGGVSDEDNRASDVYGTHVVFILVESCDNIAFRQAGNDYGEINGNNLNQAEELALLEDNHPDPAFEGYIDNYLRYDLSHSVDGHLAVKTTPFPKNFSEVTQFPNRVIRSRTDDDVLESDLFRVFLAEDYLDLPRNRGEITNLEVLQNILIAHMRRGLFKTRGREELVTADFRAFLGNGNIFAVKPDELFSVEEGYAGLQNARSSVVTPMGYFFVDQQARKVFSVAGSPVEISEAGMRNFFEDNLPWKINELEDGIADKLIKPEILMSYDPEYKRVILTKRDWSPTTALINATWSVADGELLVDGSPIDWTNETYLQDESFTISYLPEIQRWASFHTYHADYMYNDINKMYSVKDGDVYDHKGSPAEFYGSQDDMIYEFVNNENPEQTKLVRNVEFITYAYDVGSPDRVNYKKTFDAIRISNELQDTGKVDLIYFTDPGGNVRNSGHTWKANKFRDIINPDTGAVDETLPFHRKKKLTGKYAIVRLYYTPEDARFLRLISSDVNFRKHNR